MKRTACVMVLIFVVAVMLGACGSDKSSALSYTTLVIQNNSGKDINEVYVVAAPSGFSGTWGTDLCDTTIVSGATWTVGTIASGTHDVRVVATDASWRDWYNEPISGALVTWPVGSFI